MKYNDQLVVTEANVPFIALGFYYLKGQNIKERPPHQTQRSQCLYRQLHKGSLQILLSGFFPSFSVKGVPEFVHLDVECIRIAEETTNSSPSLILFDRSIEKKRLKILSSIALTVFGRKIQRIAPKDCVW